MTKVVILAGGAGTRLQELTGEVPKPMLLVRGVPILQHIIDKFVVSGYSDFIVPIGYLGDKIKSYMLSKYGLVESHNSHSTYGSDGITITVVDTGLNTQTGGRLKRVGDFIGNEPFMFTYGDGLSNINPLFVQQHGEEFNKCVVTAVHPPPRFGKLQVSPDGDVVSFSEKTIGAGEWINGGFMYLLPFVLDFIVGDASNLETDVMPKLCWDSNLLAFKYEGLWHCIDTLRDLRMAEELAAKGEFRWIK